MHSLDAPCHDHEAPLVSAVLVVRNERKHIETSLLSLTRQDYPLCRMEFLFVDGCSDDGTDVVLRNEVARLQAEGLRATFIRNKEKALAAGWNLAIKAASGQFICRIDAHSSISANYIRVGVGFLLSPGNENVAAVGGWLLHSGEGRTARMIALLFSSRFAVGNSPYRRRPSTSRETDTVVYGVYRKQVFDTLGLFDESLWRNQDIVFHRRVRDAGLLLVTHSEMEITYYVRRSVRSLMVKAFADGRWVALAGGSRFYLRHKAPLCFVSYLAALFALLMLFLFRTTPLGFWLIGIAGLPLLIYLALGVVASVRISGGHIMSSAQLLLLFLGFHLSYGLGTMLGLMERNWPFRLHGKAAR